MFVWMVGMWMLVEGRGMIGLFVGFEVFVDDLIWLLIEVGLYFDFCVFVWLFKDVEKFDQDIVWSIMIVQVWML